MIFVTVGTHKDPFDRLVKTVDELVARGAIKDKVVMQTGNSKYEPKSCEFYRFVGSDKFEELYKTADIIICHAGAGSIINALKNKKHLVIVPRLKKFHEHTDDHQLDLADAMEKDGKAVCVRDIETIPDAVKKASASSVPSAGGMLEKKINDYLKTLDVVK
ncbi:MAG: beta-1,4-galactosyltransferase [Candidatus Aenigmarchaeota archaeon]|nr:beta-1,4-galactosyltransferase [Candidatus Aenigmarchaeota archaeon]